MYEGHLSFFIVLLLKPILFFWRLLIKSVKSNSIFVVFRLHCQHNVHGMWPIAIDVTCCVVCVCVSLAQVCYAIMAKPVNVPIEELTHGSKEACIRWGSMETALLKRSCPGPL